MSATTTRSMVASRVVGALALTVLIVGSGTVLAGYGGRFSGAMHVDLRTDRAGLLLDRGAAVRVRGVRVGQVSNVASDGGQAVITLAIDPDRAARIPANVQAELKPTTIFGAKFVELVVPSAPSAQPLGDGQRVTETGGALEANEVFENLVGVLDSVQPAKVNKALSALSTGLSGRGKDLGTAISTANTYLGEIEPSLDDLRRDVRLAGQVAPVYQKAYPLYVDALDNFRTTSATLVQQQAAIGVFLDDLRVATGTTTALGVDASGPLTSAVSRLNKPTVTLNRYAPMLTCTVQGAAELDRMFVQSGSHYPSGGLVNSLLLPKGVTYKYPQDLPKVAEDGGPDCYGLPYISGTNPAKAYRFDDGVTSK
jgi:phospholipid/cholesterol/gamma-HCH transport system substrate-binding protein